MDLPRAGSSSQQAASRTFGIVFSTSAYTPTCPCAKLMNAMERGMKQSLE